MKPLLNKVSIRDLRPAPALLFLLTMAVGSVLFSAPAAAVKRPIAIQSSPIMAPVKLPDGRLRQAEVSIFTVIPDAKFIEAACAYRATVRDAARRALSASPMTLDEWGRLERGSQDARLSATIKNYVRREWITRIHAVAGPRARPTYTIWYDSVRILSCADWDRWKNRKPPPPPPMFSEPLFKQFRD